MTWFKHTLTPLQIAQQCGLNLLDELAAGDLDGAADFLLVHDTTAGTRKKYKPAGLLTSLNLVTAAAAFATDNRLLRSDGAGRGAQASAITVDDSGNLSGAASVVIGTDPTGSELLRVGGAGRFGSTLTAGGSSTGRTFVANSSNADGSVFVLQNSTVDWGYVGSYKYGLGSGSATDLLLMTIPASSSIQLAPEGVVRVQITKTDPGSVVADRVAIGGGTVRTAGKVVVSDATDSTSATDTSASINTAGGLAVAKSIFSGRALVITDAATSNPYIILRDGTGDSTLQIQSGSLYLQPRVKIVVTTEAAFTNTTDATDKDTAAIVTEGGIAAEKSIFAGGDLQCSGVLKIDGTQVVKEQQSAVADATGAGDVVAQLNALLARCRAHGLIAT